MEFEIDDGETMLFDKSTNPSLLHHGFAPPRKPTRRALRRKGLGIPEEEGRRA